MAAKRAARAALAVNTGGAENGTLSVVLLVADLDKMVAGNVQRPR